MEGAERINSREILRNESRENDVLRPPNYSQKEGREMTRS